MLLTSVLASCGPDQNQSKSSAPQPQTSAPRASVTKGIDVTNASFGANCGARAGNWTDAVRRVCDGKADCTYSNFSVDAEKLGDPSPGCGKTFVIEYVCKPGNARKTAELAAGVIVAVPLACPD